MKMNRIQFQRGLSLSTFLSEYGTESQCEVALEKMRWPEGFQCPKCASKNHYIVKHGRVKTFQCNGCRTHTTLTSGTIFHSTKLPLVKWFQAMFFMTQSKNNISGIELMRLIDVNYRTVWRVKQKLMQVMHEREQTTKLCGRVEVDDAYLGGENPGGKVGRGSENKVPFVAAVQTNKKGHPIYAKFSVVKSFSHEEIEAWVSRSLQPGTVVVSDGMYCFQAVTNAGHTHEREVVGKHRKSTSMDCFKWVNTVLGNLKNAITGTYHALNFRKYAYRYCSEYQYRFNRRFDLASMLPRLLFAGVRTGSRPESWLRVAADQH